jgi:hypothetical protein
VAILDALDEEAVNEHARAMAAQAGSIDVAFNLVTRGDVQGIPLVEMATDDLLRAVVNGLRSSEAGTASEISPSTPAATALALFAPEARSRTSRASKMVAIPPVIALSGARFLSKSAALTRRIQLLDPPR